MKRTMLAALIGVVVSGPALGDSEDMKIFGSCAVQTRVDDFTDEKSPQLLCLAEGEGLGKFGLGVSCSKKGFLTFLKAGIQINFEDTITTLYRFDKEELNTEKWQWARSSNTAATFDKSTYDKVVRGIATARRLVFKVGNKQGTVNLTGASAAVNEYTKRCVNLERQ